MTDQEKKIAEIEVRELLEGKRIMLSMTFHEASKELLAELDRERKENRKLREERDAYYNNARYTEAAFHEVTSLRSQLQSVQQEIERIIEILKNGQPAHWQAFKIRQLLGVTME